MPLNSDDRLDDGIRVDCSSEYANYWPWQLSPADQSADCWCALQAVADTTRSSRAPNGNRIDVPANAIPFTEIIKAEKSSQSSSHGEHGACNEALAPAWLDPPIAEHLAYVSFGSIWV